MTPQADGDAREPRDIIEVHAKFVSIGDDMLGVVMPESGWAALLDAMSAANGVDENLDAFYEAFKHGLGFRAPDELMRPNAPGLES